MCEVVNFYVYDLGKRIRAEEAMTDNVKVAVRVRPFISFSPIKVDIIALFGVLILKNTKITPMAFFEEVKRAKALTCHHGNRGM